MNLPPSDDSAPLSPNERATGLLALATVIATAWMMAGRSATAPWWYLPLACLTAITAGVLARREGRPLHWRAFLPAGLFALMVGVSLLNVSYMPLAENPRFMVSRPGWLPWLPGTVARDLTLEGALPWLAALLLGGALRQAGFGIRGTRLLWAALLIHGLVLAAVGVYFHITDPGNILGFKHDPFGYHFASFVYRNHWAAYVVMLSAVALGFSFVALRRWMKTRRRLDDVLPGLVVALVLALTLPIPGSRSGLVLAGMLLLAGLGLMLVRIAGASQVDRRVRRLLFAALLGFVVVIAAIGAGMNKDGLRKHWERTLQQVEGARHGQVSMRVAFSRDTVRMAMDRPIWGWGTGTFERVYRTYAGEYLRDSSGKLTARLLRAHNDWAQMWAEAGLVGLAIFIVPVAVRLRRILSDPHPLTRWAAVGLVTILLYAFVDFPFNNPAVLFLWVTVFATAAPGGESSAEPCRR